MAFSLPRKREWWEEDIPPPTIPLIPFGEYGVVPRQPSEEELLAALYSARRGERERFGVDISPEEIIGGGPQLPLSLPRVRPSPSPRSELDFPTYGDRVGQALSEGLVQPHSTRDEGLDMLLNALMPLAATPLAAPALGISNVGKLIPQLLAGAIALPIQESASVGVGAGRALAKGAGRAQLGIAEALGQAPRQETMVLGKRGRRPPPTPPEPEPLRKGEKPSIEKEPIDELFYDLTPESIMDLSETDINRLNSINSIIGQRIEYGLRDEVITGRNPKRLVWSNAGAEWYIETVNKKKGDNVRLDANQVLVYGSHHDIEKIIKTLDPLPLYSGSAESKQRGVYEPLIHERGIKLAEEDNARKVLEEFDTGGARAETSPLSASIPEASSLELQELDDSIVLRSIMKKLEELGVPESERLGMATKTIQGYVKSLEGSLRESTKDKAFMAMTADEQRAFLQAKLQEQATGPGAPVTGGEEGTLLGQIAAGRGGLPPRQPPAAVAGLPSEGPDPYAHARGIRGITPSTTPLQPASKKAAIESRAHDLLRRENEEIESGIIPDPFRIYNSVSRSIVLGMDAGSTFIQGMPTFIYSPKIWLDGVNVGFKAIRDPLQRHRFYASMELRSPGILDRAKRDGMQLGRGGAEFALPTVLSEKIKEVPVLGAIASVGSRAAEAATGYFVGTTDAWRLLMYEAMTAGRNPSDKAFGKRAADVANVLTLTTTVGRDLPAQRMTSALLLAARFYQAQGEYILRQFSKKGSVKGFGKALAGAGGEPEDALRANLARWAVGAFAATEGINRSQGKETSWDIKDPQFAEIRIGGNDMSLLGPFRFWFRLGGNVIEDLENDGNFGKAMQKAFGYFLQAKGSPIISAAADAIPIWGAGKTLGGYEMGANKMFAGDILEGIWELVLAKQTPIAAGNAMRDTLDAVKGAGGIEGVSEMLNRYVGSIESEKDRNIANRLLEGLFGTGLSFFGLPTRPPSRTERANQYLAEFGGYKNEVDGGPAMKVEELTTRQKNELYRKMEEGGTLTTREIEKDKLLVDTTKVKKEIYDEMLDVEKELPNYWAKKPSKHTIEDYNKLIHDYRISLATIARINATSKAYMQSVNDLAAKGEGGSKALSGYYDLFKSLTGNKIISTVDTDVFNQLDGYIGGLSSGEREFVLKSLGVNDTPLMNERRQAMGRLQEYFRIRQDEERKPSYKKLETLGEGPEKRRLEAQLNSVVMARRDTLRAKDKVVEELVVKWLGLVPMKEKGRRSKGGF